MVVKLSYSRPIGHFHISSERGCSSLLYCPYIRISTVSVSLNKDFFTFFGAINFKKSWVLKAVDRYRKLVANGFNRLCVDGLNCTYLSPSRKIAYLSL